MTESRTGKLRRIARLLTVAMVLGVSAAVGQTTRDWTAMSSGTTANLWGVAARSGVVEGRGFEQAVAVGEQGTILTSDDGGLTWQRRNSGVSSWLTGVAWISISTVERWFAVGEGGVILSSSDGVQWQREAAPVMTRLNGVGRIGREVVVVGEPGTGLLTRQANGIWTRSDPEIGERWLRGIAAQFVVGQSGTILRAQNETNGTTSWQIESSPVSADLESVAFGAAEGQSIGSAHVAVGANGTILRGGFNGWTVVPSGTTERLRGVIWKRGGGQILITLQYRVDFGEFFAVGTGGTILRSADGAAWQREASPTSRNLNAVAPTLNAILAVGDGGTILRLAGGPPRIIRQPFMAYDENGAPFMEADVSDDGAITYQWVAIAAAGAPYPIGVEGKRQLVPGPQVFLPSRMYQLIAANAFGVTRSDTFVANRFLNLSTLAAAGSGDATLIAGFTLAGGEPSQTRTVLIRAVGPTLRDFGVANPVATLRLSVYSGAQLIAANAGWSGVANAPSVREAMQRSGAFPLPDGSADAALLLELPPGAYTAHVESGAGANGAALLEVYDTAAPTFTRVTNLSARARVSSGEPALVGGLVIEGGLRKRVLVRAAGPALATLGVRDALARPMLAVLKDGRVVATAGAWGASADAAQIRTRAELANAFPFAEGSADSALLIDLEPGNYTVQVGSADGGAGVALIEVYETR